MSQLAQELIAENKRTQAKSLDLGNCGLTDLEKQVPELFDCVWLEELSIRSEFGDENDNNLSTIPSKIVQLTDLKTLKIGGDFFESWEITNIRFLEKLTGLQTLYLSYNQISDYSFLEKLTALQTLYLSKNQISDYSFLEKLTSLQALNLSFNQISDIRFLEKLTSLHTLDLSKNQISDYSFLEKLTSLQALNLSFNQISDIRFLEKLTSLHTLDLSNNQISDIRFLEKLTELQALDLHSNQVSDSQFLERFMKLQTLDFRSNQISDISPFLSFIQKGTYIDLGIILKRNTINLYDNPITTPPIEIVQEGNQAILNYFEELQLQGSEVVYEAKLLILGEAGAGKTSLQRKIGDCEAKLPDEVLDTTTGIAITQHSFAAREDLPKFTMNIWDFGGQAVYHSTHQFFLSKRSLYVLVDDGRKEDRNSYWLQVQELFAQNSPLLILQNKKGDTHRPIPLNDLKSEFSNIRDLAVISLKEESNKVPAFCRTLEHYIRHLPQFQKGETLPKIWVRIREALEETEENYITLREFRQICRTQGIPEAKRQDFLSDYLHDLGVMLHFQDSPLLKKMVILKPEWATNAVYAILNHTKKQGKDGHFTYADLEQVWSDKDYQDVFEELLALMQKFELCYQLKGDKNRFIVPQLMTEKKPDYDWNTENNLQLRYEYDFMPKGIVTRFIVRRHKHIEEQRLVWQRGVVLKYKNTRAQIIEEYRNKAINIRIEGKHPQALISIITDEIDSINGSFHFNERMKVRKMVPCICPTCCESDTPELHNYDSLIASFDKGRPKFFCNTGYEFFNIMDALYNIGDSGKGIAGSAYRSKQKAVKSSNSPTSSPPKKVFISFSEKDQSYLDTLETHLSTLSRKGKLLTWNKGNVLPSEKWDERIQSALEEADLILLLISSDFLASDYIHEVEAATALRKRAIGEAAIVPIVVRPCLWESSDFEAYGVLPSGDKAISEWGNEDAAWVEVVKGIQSLL